MKTCEQCWGRGVISAENGSGLMLHCTACNGTGQIGGDEKLHVTVDIANAPAVIKVISEAREEIHRLQLEIFMLRVYVKEFTDIGYSYWTGAEYRCPHCGAGKREYNNKEEFLENREVHDKDCVWRMAAEYMDKFAPAESEGK